MRCIGTDADSSICRHAAVVVCLCVGADASYFVKMLRMQNLLQEVEEDGGEEAKEEEQPVIRSQASDVQRQESEQGGV